MEFNKDMFYAYATKFRYVNSRCREWTEAMKDNSIGEYTHGDAMTPDAMLSIGNFLLGYAACEYPREKTFYILERCIYDDINDNSKIDEYYDKIIETSSEELSNEYFTQPKEKMFQIVLDSMKEIALGDKLTGEMFEDFGLVPYASDYRCMSYLLYDCAELLCYGFGIDVHYRDMIVEFCTGTDSGFSSSAELYNKLKN